MPSLTSNSEAHKAYVALKGDDVYASYELKTSMRAAPSESAQSPPATIHGLHHDAESVYWVLVDFLAFSIPEGAEDKCINEHFNKLCHDMFSDRTDMNHDGRIDLLNSLSSQPEVFLHPGLKDIAPFLGKISRVVNPEYAWLETDPPVDYLHEAMQRLLLTQIFKMREDPVPIVVDEERLPDDAECRYRLYYKYH